MFAERDGNPKNLACGRDRVVIAVDGDMIMARTAKLLRSGGGERRGFSKKNLNASRPSEHPPVRGENVKLHVTHKTVNIYYYCTVVQVCNIFLYEQTATKVRTVSRAAADPASRVIE